MRRSPIPGGPLPEPKAKPIGILAFDGVEIIDLTGPLDVFALSNEGFKRAGFSQEPLYPIRMFAKQAELVTTSCGLQINATCAYGELRDDIDTLVVPGSPDIDAVLADPALRDWILAMSGQVRRVVSVCTGAFMLAWAGLLDGRRATTHWAYCERLAADYPAVTVEADRIFLQDGPVFTSGGITSGIDLALALVEEDWGRDHALAIARMMVMFLKRPGGQSQFSGYLVCEAASHPSLRKLMAWIMENPAEDLSVQSLAERMAMSPRHFARVFQEESGMTPAKFVEKARIDAARQHLGDGAIRVETAAAVSGFGDPERMRRAFIRHLGISPQDYRERFGSSALRLTPMATERAKSAVIASLNDF
jgi:transcriptional regulator GlxA family with amidase domain